MNNLELIKCKYYELDDLISSYHNNLIKDFSKIGILGNYKTSISDILYKEYSIGKGKNSIFINKNSFIKNNIAYVKYLIEYIEYSTTFSILPSTIIDHINFIKRFIHFMNKEEIPFINNIEKAKEVFEVYSFYLAAQNRKEERNTHNQRFQSFSLKYLTFIFNDEEGYISSDVILMKAERKRKNNVIPSKEEDSSYAFKFYLNLFNQLADFLLEFKKYPYKIILPSESLWILPLKNWISPSFKKNKNINFDYSKGKLQSKYSNDKLTYYQIGTITKLEKAIKLNNLNHNTNVRMELARFALKAYFMHFLAVTGMNDSTASNILWNSDYEIVKTRQKFSAIKHRANNKTMHHEIASKYINDFQKFVKVREFLLLGNQFKYLFFENYGDNAYISSIQKKGCFSYRINLQMRQLIDNKLPMLNSRNLRVNKSNYNTKKHGVVKSALMSGNSIAVTLEHYSDQHEDIRSEEMTSYFNNIEKSLVSKDNKLSDIPTGRCKDINNPLSNMKLNNVSINCEQKEGCLFCSQYRVHAEKEDAYKLYSLLYIINETRYLAKNDDHFNDTYDVVIKRINIIIEDISVYLDKKNLLEIERDVFDNENLHPYWEHKLNMLITAGVLI